MLRRGSPSRRRPCHHGGVHAWTSTATWLAACLLVTAACGGSSPTEPSTGGSPQDTGGSVGQGDGDAPPLAEGCPPTVEQAEGQLCATDGVAPTETCAYRGGAECGCAEQPICSGAERAPAPVEDYVWVCRRPPPEVRADGCPGSMPPEGSDCEPVGKRCGYGDCCVTSIECTAQGWGRPAPALCPP